MSQFPQPQYPQPQQPPYPQQPPVPQNWSPPQPPPPPPPQGQWQQPAQAPGNYPQPQYPQPQPPQQGWGQQPTHAAPPPSVPPQRQVNPNLFSGIAGTKPSIKANYVRPGFYWGRVDECKTFLNNTNQERAAVVMTVLKVYENYAGRGHRVGESVSQMFKNSGSGARYFRGEIVSFIGNTMGIQPEQVTEEQCNTVFSPQQPLRGTIVEFVATDIMTQAGKPFTTCTFRREVTAQEALATLDPQTVASFFPNGALQRMAEFEKQNGIKPGFSSSPVPPGPQQPPQQPSAPAPAYGAPAAPAPAPQPYPAAAPVAAPPPQGQWVQDPSQPNGWRWVPVGR